MTNEWIILTRGLGGGAAVAAITVSVAALTARTSGIAQAEEVSTNELPAAAKWKLTDSWATNLTALSGAIGLAVVAVSDTLSGLISKEQAAAYAVTAAILATTVALSPITYAALQGTDADGPAGTWTGVLASAWLTLTGTFGAIAATTGLMSKGPIPGSTVTPVPLEPRDVSPAIWVVVALVGTLVAVYAVRTLVAVKRWSRTPASGGVRPTGPVSVEVRESNSVANTRTVLL